MFEEFRQYAKARLKRDGITYAQLSKTMGIAENTLKYFMCGASDSRRVAEKIADALGVTITYSNQEYIVESKETQH